MQALFGTYGFPVNGALIGTHTEVIRNAGGVPYKLKQSIAVTGSLLVAGQADAALQESQMRTALMIPYQDLKFLQDSGATTPVGLTNLGSLSGVICTRLRFPTTDRGEYATLRHFEAEFEAEYVYPTLNPFAQLLEFTETLSFEGGLPIFRHRLAVEGYNQKQLVYPQDTYRAIQSGTAKGRIAYPTVPGPIWPFALKEAPKISNTSPHLDGLVFEGFGVSWHYEYEDIGPLIGLPNLWPN